MSYEEGVKWFDHTTHILNEIKSAKGTNAKKELIRQNVDNEHLGSVLFDTFNPYISFNIVKVPKVKNRNPIYPSDAWQLFFDNAKKCAKREVTGNAAIDLIVETFSKCSKEQEAWMRKILKKNLAIGISTKSINSVSPGFIPTFDVALAQKYDFKRIKTEVVAVEPKLDGIRCEGIVINSEAKLYARSGKLITNFDDTIGKDLSQLPDGVYEGEIMGEDFTALMRQAYRKEEVDTSNTYLAVFDFIPLEEWMSKESWTPCDTRYLEVIRRLSGQEPESTGMTKYKSIYPNLRIVERRYIRSNHDRIKELHDMYVEKGYEGAMIKDPVAPYSFKRDWSVMKYKAFFDADCSVIGLQEGTGKHSGKLGSFLVDYNGVEVRVGSGLNDELRETIWANKEDHIGRIIEVRYQEETPDGSLRFPTFVCFRNDR